jgi:hypothetical protein
VPLAFVGVGVLAVVGVEFFEFPLDATFGPATVLLAVTAPALGAICATTGVGLARRLGTWREAVLVAVIAVIAFAAVVPVDLVHWYPRVYFQAHRQQFVLVADITQSHAPPEGQRHTVGLPSRLALVNGSVDVLTEHRGVVLEVLMEEASGVGYGYIHAPWAGHGDTVDTDLGLQVVMNLGEGWWWAET